MPIDSTFLKKLFKKPTRLEILIVLLMLGVIYVLFETMMGSVELKSYHSNAQKLLGTYLVEQSTYHATHGSYIKNLQLISKNQLEENPIYTIVEDTSLNPSYKKYCPDCGVSKSHFKAMAFAKRTEGEETFVDIWTINERAMLDTREMAE